MPIELTNRVFTTANSHPYEIVKWEKTPVKITDESGNILYELDDAEFPSTWSKTARKITANKYFRESRDSREKESSLRETIGRVVNFITTKGVQHGYFEDKSESLAIYATELMHILLHQIAAFNSPVWFNAGIPGVEKPLLSACFINQVDDNMESILDLAKTEGLIFKEGAGSGVNFSRLRASTERIRGGGTASGPVSFMQGYDSFANIIMSGGRTRRSARMCILNADHPDIEKFISCKNEQEAIVERLIKSGMSARFNDLEGAYSWAKHQTGNNSVRVTNEFMERVRQHMYYGKEEKWNLINRADGSIARTVNIGELFTKIAECAHGCGDPALQFHDTINGMNTCASDFTIEASNPCGEYLFTNNSACNLASINLVKFMRNDTPFDTKTLKHVVRIMTIAQDIIVESASYPTKEIEINSLKYRPLGLGYANLGSLLMRWGIPYDSDKGREIAASITSLITAQAYTTSAELATVKGPFTAYEYNKISMEEVLTKHRAFTKKIPESNLQLVAYKAWGEALAAGFGKKKEEGAGYRNAQVTVLAPTGCVVGDTLVLSSEGLIPISELGEISGDKWQNIQIKVRQEAQVTDATKFFVNGEDSIVTLITKKGHEITCTLKHKLRVLDTEGNYSWKEAYKIKQGEYVALKLGGHESLLAKKDYQPLTNIETTHALSTVLNLPEVLDEGTAEILGFYQGNGYTKRKGGLHFVICNDYYDLIDHFNIWATNTGITPTLEQRDGCFVWNAFSRILRPWFKLNNLAKNEGNKGAGAASAFIPKAVLKSRTSVLCAFLRGLFEADGTVSLQGKDGTPTVELTTVSSVLAVQVHTALESMGIMAHKCVREPKENCYGYRTKYRIRVSGVQSAKLFQEKIGFLSHGKKKKLSAGLSRANFMEDRLSGICNQVMINEFYAASAGLPSKIRQDIAARKNGKFSLTWALSLVSIYPQLSKTKIAELKPLVESQVYFVQVADNISGKQALTYDLSVPDNNTYIAGGFVSHNTIAFMMDCDTTGIEPAMGLVTYKDMVGGGTLKIAVDAIPEALSSLGYSTSIIPKILQYVSDNGYVEGCPDLKEEHLPVFDCAFVAKTRTISVEGHINMVAAVQPFLSGGVSKTFNMPKSATVNEVKRAYMMAWERGLKGVAIYRQGSKFSEPMRAREILAAVEEKKSIVPTRKELPTTVISIRHVFTVGAHKIHLHCGLDPKTGDIMEIFIRAGGFGSTVGGLLDSYATLFSKSLQYGIPLDVCIKHMEGSNFPPAGVTSNNSIPMVKSIMDYVAQWMKKEFIDKKASPMTLAHPDTENGVSYTPYADDTEVSNLGEDTCPRCGHLMVRTGSCTMCKNCSHNTGVCG